MPFNVITDISIQQHALIKLVAHTHCCTVAAAAASAACLVCKQIF